MEKTKKWLEAQTHKLTKVSETKSTEKKTVNTETLDKGNLMDAQGSKATDARKGEVSLVPPATPGKGETKEQNEDTKLSDGKASEGLG